tara:strand:- start:1830 stop:2240 length:411 start_codon:yes stop_codon:yes gene_type:complete
MYRIEDIWQQVSTSPGNVPLTTVKGKSYFYKGLKVQKIKDEIKIYNTKKRGDYYSEVTSEQLNSFLEHGLRYGSYVVLLDNYQYSINAYTERLKTEVNVRNNAKHFLALKEARDNIIKKYAQIRKMKNQLINNSIL